MRAHKHRLLTDETPTVDGEPGSRRNQHRLVPDKGDLPAGVALVEFLLDGLVEAEHADEVAGGPLAAIEVNERRLVLKMADFWNSDLPVDLDETVLLEKEEQHAAHFVGDIGRPVGLKLEGNSGIHKIGVRERRGDENLLLFGSALLVVLDFRDGFGLDDLAYVLAAEGVRVSSGALHQNVDQLVKNDNGNLFRL